MGADSPVVQLGERVLGVLRQGTAVVVGTADSERQPEISRAWGPLWHPQTGTFELLLPLPAAERTLQNLQQAPAVAFTFVVPTNYAAFQLKGRALSQGEPSAQQWRRARDHFDLFLAELPAVGLEPAVYGPWFPARGAVLLAQIDSVFDQSPGPKAGLAL